MDAYTEFEHYLTYLAQGPGHVDRHAGLSGYCAGLMLPLSRKSVEPMAARIDPLHASAKHQSMHHFVAQSQWSDKQMLRRVAQWVVPHTAVLLGWVYGTGKVTTKDRVLAHEYELIAAKMDSKKIVPILWGNMLDEEKKKKAEGFAQNWIAKHRKPKNMDFSSTFNGLEEQFGK